MRKIKRVLKSAEECLGKTVIYDGLKMKVLKLFYLRDEDTVRMRVLFLANGDIGYLWFIREAFSTYIPRYINRWKDRIG